MNPEKALGDRPGEPRVCSRTGWQSQTSALLSNPHLVTFKPEEQETRLPIQIEMPVRPPRPLSGLTRRHFAISARRFYSAGARAPAFPTVPACPTPTCECAATPAMPDGLEIDHKGKLNGLISNYSEQVLICTGKDDWPSRIEEDNSGDNLAADLKELFGRGGVYSDVSRTLEPACFKTGWVRSLLTVSLFLSRLAALSQYLRSQLVLRVLCP